MMNLLRTIELALKSLLLHKLRSGLTMLGIVFGVFSVIAMLAIGEGASQQAQEQVLKLGATNIIIRSVKPPRENASSTSQNSFVLRYGLLRADYDLLSRTIPTVEQAIPIRELIEAVPLSASRNELPNRRLYSGLSGRQPSDPGSGTIHHRRRPSHQRQRGCPGSGFGTKLVSIRRPAGKDCQDRRSHDTRLSVSRNPAKPVPPSAAACRDRTTTTTFTFHSKHCECAWAIWTLIGGQVHSALKKSN